MNREQIEHAIRATGDVLGENDLLLVGSQSILGALDKGLPKELLLSVEVDVMMREDPLDEKQYLVNGQLGELSQFHDTNGYYVEAVGEGLCVFPTGWRDRLFRILTPATNGITGWCPEPHDLAISKLVAGRKKDVAYVLSLLRSGHLLPSTLLARAEDAQLQDHTKELVLGVIVRAGTPGRRNPTRHMVRTYRDHLSARRDVIPEADSE